VGADGVFEDVVPNGAERDILPAVMKFGLRLAVFVMTTWFTLDASTPLVPGAFQFNPDDSIEGVSASHHSLVAPIHRHAVAPTSEQLASPRGDIAIHRRASPSLPVRFVRRDRSRPQDHHHVSSVGPSDPA
jgi:hypothetical protein